eukprot:gene10345-12706_t
MTGINVWVKNGIQPDKHYPFEIEDDESVNEFSELIDSIPPLTKIQITIYSGKLNRVNQQLLDSFSKFGCCGVYKLKPGYIYTSIGFKGQTIGTALETNGNPNGGELRHSWYTEILSIKYDQLSTDPVLNLSTEKQAEGHYNVVTFETDLSIIRNRLVSFRPTETFEFIKYIESIDNDTMFLVYTKGNGKYTAIDDKRLELAIPNSKHFNRYLNSLQDGVKWVLLTKKSNDRPYFESLAPLGESMFAQFTTIRNDRKRDEMEGNVKGLIPLRQYKDISVSVYSSWNKQTRSLIVVDDRFYTTENQKQYISTGLLMVTINEINGQVYQSRFYYLESPLMIKKMTRDIYELSVGTIVVVCLYHPPGYYDPSQPPPSIEISNEFEMALHSIGSQSPKKIFSSHPSIPTTYTLIGRKGSSPGSCPEMISKNGDQISLYHYFTIQNRVVKPVIDIPLESNNNEIGNLPKVVKNSIIRYLGLNQIVKYEKDGGSYFIISEFGSSKTTKVGQLRIPIESVSTTTFPINEEPNYSIYCISKGAETKSDNGDCEILVNGRPLKQKTDGLNVVYIVQTKKEKPRFETTQTCTVKGEIIEKHYNTTSKDTNHRKLEWNRFTDDITSCKNGTIVSIAIKKSMGRINDNEEIHYLQKLSLSSIGGCKFRSVPLNGSYSIIGIKGLPPGSANEYFGDGNNLVCTSFWIPTRPIDFISQPPFALNNNFNNSPLLSSPLYNYFYQQQQQHLHY